MLFISLNKHRHVIKAVLLKTLTESLLLSHLLYFLPVWGPRYNLYRLQQMQNHAVLLYKDLHKYDHVSHLYPALNSFQLSCWSSIIVYVLSTINLSFSAHNRSHLLHLAIPFTCNKIIHLAIFPTLIFFALKPCSGETVSPRKCLCTEFLFNFIFAFIGQLIVYNLFNYCVFLC